jgi:hypothetical protein
MVGPARRHTLTEQNKYNKAKAAQKKIKLIFEKHLKIITTH